MRMTVGLEMTRCRGFCVAAAVFMLTLAAHGSCALGQAPADAGATEAPPPVMAKQYNEYRPAELPSPAKIRVLRSEIMAVLRLGTFENDDQKKKFNDYYKYRIAEMTWAENLHDLPKKRGDLKKQDLKMASTAPEKQVHEQLNQLLLAATGNFAGDASYHPAVRLNMVLLLGMLDQQEPDGLGLNNIPLPAALDRLIALLGDPKQLDAVRVGAMIGIDRHARQPMQPPARSAVVKALTSPLNFANPAAAALVRHRAVITLGMMAAKWPEANRPEVVALMQQVLADPEATLLARCDAARALGSVEKSAFAGAAVQQLASTAGLLAAELGKSATDPNMKFVDEKNSLQPLTSQLLCVHMGLKGTDANHGLASAAPNNETKQFITELAGKVNQL
ncbi:MAG TPA: hypothetical protein VG713_16385, partial [Pirellulales bacterium]|nr:hypothetical protein [Pirellulales bacterium]